VKEKGIATAVIVAVIVAILVVAGVGAYFLMKPGEEEGGEAGIEWFQTGNTLPMTQLQPKQSSELENNRIGDMWTLKGFYTEQDGDWFVESEINELGLKWTRLSIDWFDWNEVESTGEYSENYIDPNQDRAITALADNGIKIMYTLVYWDEAIEVEENYSRFKTEDEIQRYLDYVQFIVHNFKDRIKYYEILNEPNIGEGTQQYVELADYINLVERTVQIIRQEYPEAKIVVGAVTPLYCIEDIIRIEPGAREYLFGILESDVIPSVDAISWHAMGGASPEHGEEYYYNYPSIVENIKDVASAHGFEGEYIAEELHWRTPESPHPHEYDEYSETAAAKYLARGIVMHLGTDLTTGLALESLEELPLIASAIQNLCTIMAGAEPVSLPMEIQSGATNIENYSFSLPNGDTLVALWTDGVAVDSDSGVKANLTCQGFTAQDVMGIDVLEGYQQSIITSNESGNLVIENLIVRDYPLILRIKWLK